MADDEDKKQRHEMTQEQKGKALALLEKYSPQGMECPLCKSNSWTIPGHLVTPLVHSGGIQVGGTPVYPQFMAVCTTCGYTLYINAVVSKVLEKEKEENEAESANG